MVKFQIPVEVFSGVEVEMEVEAEIFEDAYTREVWAELNAVSFAGTALKLDILPTELRQELCSRAFSEIEKKLVYEYE